MMALSYIKGQRQKIKIGLELYFGQLWDGYGEAHEVLQSGSIVMIGDTCQDDITVKFEIIREDECEVFDTLVRVTDIL